MKMKLTKEKQAYLDVCKRYGVSGDVATKIYRLAMKHGRLQEKKCNEPMSNADWNRETRVETKIKSFLPHNISVDFSGDPRGFTVKLHFPGGEHNTWGGRESGYGVPQE